MPMPGVAGEVDETLPSEIALVHAFVNTLDLRSFSYHGQRLVGRDLIADPAGLADWLRGRGFLDPDLVVTASDARRAIALRDALRAAVPGGSRTGGRSWPLSVVVSPGRPPTLAPQGSGVPAALGTILIQAVGAGASGLWSRLRVCAAEDCRWVFYDRSRPGRGRWCDPQLCGNRMKTRAYRTRHNRPADD